jgi:methyl halide transferase
MTAKTTPTSVDQPEFWENLYRTNVTPWDLAGYAPPFRTFLNSPYAVPPGTVAVLGCGAGHECMLFASRGFRVVAIDFAPSAIALTRDKFAKVGILDQSGFVMQRDIFDLHECAGKFDYVVEHTCFCAIHPSRRASYALAVQDLLKIGGKLIALWWLLDKAGGPPFAVDKHEIFTLFKNNFSFDIVYEPQDSVAGRAGYELFTVMSRTK